MANKFEINEDAIAFLSVGNTAEQEEPKQAVKPKKSRKGAKSVKEKKDYRINLALPKSLGEQIKAEAEKEDRSVNKFIEIILQEYLKKTNKTK